ncbi:MAG: Rpn family recombination-promoting nuclease/putative transposase, partial [Planctomycetaceae bacterium]|nr:Rpn family recombination-promoting nuclease/putative transposase [Planctomycetaceae bacterium]
MNDNKKNNQNNQQNNINYGDNIKLSHNKINTSNIKSKIIIDPEKLQTCIQKLTHPHDLLFRSIFVDLDVSGNFFENYLDPNIVQVIDFSQLQSCQTNYIDNDLQERIGDLHFLAKCKSESEESESDEDQSLQVTLIFEHQSTPDPIMSLRVLELIVLSFRQFIKEYETKHEKKFSTSQTRLPYPLIVILYNGKTPWNYKNIIDLIDIPYGFDKNILYVKVLIINVCSLTDEQLKRGMPIVKASMQVFRCEIEGTLPENIENIFKTIAEAQDDIRVKDWFDKVLRYVLANCPIPKGKELETIETVYSIISNDPEEVKKMTETA